MNSFKIVFLTYIKTKHGKPEDIEKDWPSLFLVPQVLARQHEVHLVVRAEKSQRASYKGLEIHWIADTLPVHLRWFQVPRAFHRFIRAICPDFVHIHSLSFPLQIWLSGLPRQKTILQHHAEVPLSGFLRILQILSYRGRKTMFSSRELTGPWLGVIDSEKICLGLESSSDFRPVGPRKELSGFPNLLWVGRLAPIKDPLTVLKGLVELANTFPSLQAHFIYQENDLLSEMQELVKRQPESIAQRLHFHGKVEHKDLPAYFSASQFYISGSLNESTGFTLLEAMACGCIPVVTKIPAFEVITMNGTIGGLWTPQSAESLVECFGNLMKKDIEQLMTETQSHFRQFWAPEAVAEQWLRAYEG